MPQCNGKHHTSICNEANKPPYTSSQSAENRDPSMTNTNTVALTTLTPQLTKSATCLLKTAIATAVERHSQTQASVLFDEGSEWSFLTEKLAGELAVEPYRFENISLSSFGTDNPCHKRMEAVLIHIMTMKRELVPLSSLVIPTIATPVNRCPLNTDVLQLPHLKGLPVARPVTAAENFENLLLVGVDFYWDLLGDHIVRGDGTTAMSLKLGYLLSETVLLPQNPSAIITILNVAAEHDQGGAISWDSGILRILQSHLM